MSTLLRNARVIDGLGSSLEDHGVLVDHGRIDCIAPSSEFDGFAGEIHDLSGCSVMPGLIDCHVHLVYGAEPNPGVAISRMGPGEITVRALANARESLAGGITAVRDCGGQDYLEFAVRDACIARVADRRHHRLVMKRGEIHSHGGDRVHNAPPGAIAAAG